MVRKNEHTCRWRVDFHNLAYDGGGSSSWSQFYFTKIGALWSKFWNLHISSWGGKATLLRTGDDAVCQGCDGTGHHRASQFVLCGDCWGKPPSEWGR